MQSANVEDGAGIDERTVEERVEDLSSRLPRRRGGYYRAATDALLTELALKEAELDRECSTLRDRVADLEAKLAYRQGQEELVGKTLITAMSHSMKIRENARREAELTLQEAAAKAAEDGEAVKQIAREREDAERELRHLRELTREVQRGLTGFLSKALDQLGTEVGQAPRADRISNGPSGLLIDQTLADCLEAAIRPDAR